MPIGIVFLYLSVPVSQTGRKKIEKMMRTLRHIYLAIIALVLLVRTKVRDMLYKFLGREKKVMVSKWRVVDAYVFMDPTPPDGARSLQIPQSDIDFSDPEWKTKVANIVPMSWPSWRVELVCSKKNMTRRIVCRRDERMHFPGDVANMRNTRMFPRATVTSAIVRSSLSQMDVTDKLAQYVMCNERLFHPSYLTVDGTSFFADCTLDVVATMPNGLSRKGSFEFSDPSANVVSLFTL